MYYTHKLCEISENILNRVVQISGWLHNKRDHGGVLFLDIRAFGEKVQVVVEKQEMIDFASRIKLESVIKITGEVRLRPENAVNLGLKSGKVEVVASEVFIESEAIQIPFQVNGDDEISEDLRLQYRFLDMRNEKMRKNILLRSSVISYIRKRMEQEGFVEFQTPILTASSPEGARDFLVPSRIHAGKFYALPQAPQQFKQLLMVSGFEKYFQIAPCFRDEDARADRSPGEFYQLDVEMSFATQEDVFSAIEPVMHDVFTKFANGKTVSPIPFKRIPYDVSMLKYGNDKPDLRNPIEIFDASEIFASSKFKVFASAVEKGEVVRAIPVSKHGKSTEYFKTEMQNFAKQNGAEFGIAYMIFEDGTVKNCPIRNAYKVEKNADAIHEEEFATLVESIKTAGNLQDGDAVFFACGKKHFAAKLAGLVRTKVGNDLNLINKNHFEFCWIVDFPFYEENEDEKATSPYQFSHNPFSMPQGGMDVLLLSQEETFSNILKVEDGSIVLNYSFLDTFSDETKRGIVCFLYEILSFQMISKMNEVFSPDISIDDGVRRFLELREGLKTKRSDDVHIQILKTFESILNYIKQNQYIDFTTSLTEVEMEEVCQAMTDLKDLDIPDKLNVRFNELKEIVYQQFHINPLTIKAYQYDIVCNGVELSSGAIRNHKLDVMLKAFEIAGYTEEQVRTQFAGMVNAFSYGAPPHGGIAPGIDRIVMLLAGTDSIRDIIAFPLNGKAEDLLMKAPSTVEDKQLDELRIFTEKQLKDGGLSTQKRLKKLGLKVVKDLE